MNTEKLKQLRTEKGESQFALAVAVGTNTQTIQNLEYGRTLNPGVLLVHRIAKHFGTTIEDLLEIEEK